MKVGCPGAEIQFSTQPTPKNFNKIKAHETFILVVVSNIFYFHPDLGKIPNLTNIFQMGWNHQLVV